MASVSQAHICQTSLLEGRKQACKGTPVRPCLCFQAIGYSFTFHKTQRLGSLKLQLSSQKLQGRQRRPDKYGAIPCASLAEGHNLHLESFQSRASDMLQRVSAPLQAFPWDKFSTKLMQHLADAVWIVGKWLVIPILIATAFREVVLTVSMSKELFIPIGLLAGTVLAGILKETASALGTDFQDGALPWHLVGVGLFFALVKVIVPKYPIWLRAFLLHFANGGLWQTIRYSIDWKKSKEGIPDVEEGV